MQQRLSGGYGYNGGYNGYNGYNGGYSNYAYGGGGRVLGISRVEPRSNGADRARRRDQRPLRCIRQQWLWRAGSSRPDLALQGGLPRLSSLTSIISPAQRNYGYGNNYQPYNQYDYSQYGYRRY